MNILKLIYYKLDSFFNYLTHSRRVDGLGNLWTYSPIIWHTREWDQNYLYELIAFKLRQMERHHRKEQVIANWSKVAKELLICAVSLERLIKDEYPGFVKYCESGGDLSNAEIINGHKRDEEMKQADLERFAKFFVKYSKGWWD